MCAGPPRRRRALFTRQSTRPANAHAVPSAAACAARSAISHATNAQRRPPAPLPRASSVRARSATTTSERECDTAADAAVASSDDRGRTYLKPCSLTRCGRYGNTLGSTIIAASTTSTGRSEMGDLGQRRHLESIQVDHSPPARRRPSTASGKLRRGRGDAAEATNLPRRISRLSLERDKYGGHAGRDRPIGRNSMTLS